ncbi:hypothetical protein PPO43_01305 [Saprospira sp. CCB-QB6]|uniref:hypothetical protein n=1 Tax=Saprospira sp. CCB-QB6 TaxID=3023936 RepID=UPI00234B0081|nr:hypothetical protein [Saprospira sp. CCB-QB6]WCL81732.1 hypothetical protein PPO43_01305 [Saprospira sp. CCB-QB6]
MLKAVEDFNPLRTIYVECSCCMAVGFNPQYWPSDAKGGGAAADQGRQAAGPSRTASPEA